MKKSSTAYDMLPISRYGTPCDFADVSRAFILQDNIRGTTSMIKLPKGIATLDEFIRYRQYKRDNRDKPNDWDALEPKAVNINGVTVFDVKIIDNLISNPFTLQIVRNFDPKNVAHSHSDWFKALHKNMMNE